MSYLTGSANRVTDLYCRHFGYDWQIGLMVQPGTKPYLNRAFCYPYVALDNGGFSAAGRRRFEKLGLDGYLKLIDSFSEATCDDVLFATAPDVWGDWEATLEMSLPSLPLIARVTRAAIVGQDGANEKTVPWDLISCLFIGGSDGWRASPDCRRLMNAAKRRNKWLHCGRVNSQHRLQWAARCGCDSADGTFVKFRHRQCGDQLIPMIEMRGWTEAVNGPDPEMSQEDLADYRAGLYECAPSEFDELEFISNYLTSNWPKARSLPVAKKITTVVPAIRFQQGDHHLFSFVMDAKLIHEFAKVSLLKQDEAGNVEGFQREEIKTHIKEIKNYLDGENPLIPNALVIGFQKAPVFKLVNKELGFGELTISGNNALIVDGQQRSAAIRDSSKESYMMSCVGFVAEDDAEMKEHFVRTNSGKPLKKSILNALLPGIEAEINSQFAKDRLPVLLVDRLNRDGDSPLFGRIKTALNPGGFISEGTVQRMLKQSFSNTGYLFSLVGDEDMERMVMVLKNFWSAVSEVFANAWDLPPSASRLTHTAGVLGLGFLMDQIGNEMNEPEHLTKQEFIKHLSLIKSDCHWTEDSGNWIISQSEKYPWNGVENTGKGASLLAGYLNRKYRAALKPKKPKKAATATLDANGEVVEDQA